MTVSTWLRCLEKLKCGKIIQMKKEAIFGLEKEILAERFKDVGFKSFKVKQLFAWLYQRKTFVTPLMSDLSKVFRQYLEDNYDFSLLRIQKKQISTDGTVKLLSTCQDGELIETVIMSHGYGHSACISSQIGCLMACRFCASGLLKKVRDLTAAEMVLQVLTAEQECGCRIDNVVVMGSGEPFDNYDEVLKFLNIVNDDWGLAIGARHLTVSTCGIPPGIRRFAQEKPYNLAISLHAANDGLRSELMPINKAYPLREIKEALIEYQTYRNRRVSLEYILLQDVNDRPQDVDDLKNFIAGIKNVYVNLIPYNPVSECGYQGVSEMAALKFYDLLKKKNIAVTLRNRHGDDIDAACGQLRNRELEGD